MSHPVMNTSKEWGAVGCGSSDLWQVDVDETLDGGELAMQMVGPHTYLRFAIPDLQAVGRLLTYLQESAHEEPDGLALGTFGTAAVSIIQDDEFATRWFLKVQGDADAALHVTLDATDVAMIVEALEEIASQMRS